MDAVVAHSEHGAARLREEVGLPRRAGAGDPPRGLQLPDPAAGGEAAAAEELRGAEDPAVLSFGLLRPYKGLENLLEAFTGLGTGAELWIVGNPRMSRRAAARARRAAPAQGPLRQPLRRGRRDPGDLPPRRRSSRSPYLDAEHSGVLYTRPRLPGKPMVVSAVGGFPEVAEPGAARLVPPGDTVALAARAAGAGRRPRRPRGARRRRPRRRRRSLLLGRGRPPHPGASTRSCCARRDDARLDRLLGLRAGDRLRPGRLPAGAPRPGDGPARPRNDGRPAGPRPLSLASARPDARRTRRRWCPLIIPAYDEEEVIAAKVENALRLDWPRERLQIIVADDGSTDAHARAGRATRAPTSSSSSRPAARSSP